MDDLDLPAPPPTSDVHQIYTYGILGRIHDQQMRTAKDVKDLKDDQAKRWDGVERRLQPLEVELNQRKGERRGETRAWKTMKALGGMSAGGALLSIVHWLKTGHWPVAGP